MASAALSGLSVNRKANDLLVYIGKPRDVLAKNKPGMLNLFET